MRKYRASNRAPISSVLLLLILAIISGAAVGGILWAVDNYLHLYLVVAFPIIGGAVAGGLLVLGVRGGKVRNPLLAVLIGLLTGVIIYGVYHAASYYITFRNVIRDAYVENRGSTPTDEDLDNAIDLILISEVKDTGIVGYLKLLASEGLTISDTVRTSSSTDIELKDTLAWVYWAVEILLAGGIAAGLAAGAAGQPFDEEADAWYGSPVWFAVTPAKSRKALLNALKDSDYQAAGGLLTTSDIKYPRLDIQLRRSPVAATGVAPQDIYVMVNYSQRRGRTNSVRTGVISSAELDAITLGMQQAALQAPPPVPAKRGLFG